ncbi:MAG: maleylpyruvate isomerase family mycothiol-dependent enzyme [Anaerolineaceae bacterium]|nr:maleylpyruvate isomerase family mycothiol-dependent enzyme [Anaerolineaceae bacterium]
MIAAPISNLIESNIDPGIKQAETITPVSIPEAAQIAAFEVQQVLNLLGQLDGDDWTQPTDCTEWNVRDMTAHLAGACAMWASWGQFFRQSLLNPHILKTAVTVDALNRRQLEDRAGTAPRDLITELSEVGPKAVRTRRNLPGLIRKIRIPAQPMPGTMSLAYLVDVIYPRDQWMHRMDICRATGKTLVITPGHDERLLDLVMLDIATKLGGKFALIVNITGALATSYRLGSSEPQAEIDMDYRAINRRSSGRITPDAALTDVAIRGDKAVAADFLRECEVLY